MRAQRDFERDSWLFITDDGTVNSLMVRPWDNLENYLENTLEHIYEIYPSAREKGMWFFIGDLLQ